MVKKHLSLIITCVVLAVAFVLGGCILITPAPSADTQGFSAQNALSYLQEIAKQPHSVFDTEAHENVRLYIKQTLTDMGLNVEEHNWAKEDLDYMGALNSDNTLDKTKPITYDIKNLWVTIPGKSQTGVLLMAHYDSRGHSARAGELGNSYGAADDGFGVVTLLEIARLYSQVPSDQLETSIYICFTDAEETGMYGSLQESLTNEIVKNNVNFVINVEARGVAGPAYMFETSKNNIKVVDLYAKANLPMTYSVATAVYSVMTNFTDFTSMLDIGKQGINFSTLDNINYYHVPSDNLSNISTSSMQHYGSQIMPILKEYTSNAKYADINYFDATQDVVFFNVLPGVYARYSETAAIVFTLLGIAVFAVALVFMIIRRKISAKRFGVAMAVVLASVVGAALVGFVISYLTALIVGNPWNLTYLRVNGAGVPFALTFILVLAGELLFCFKKIGKSQTSATEYLTAGVAWNLLFATVTTFALAGASFLFFWPALLGAVVLLVRAFTENGIASHVLCSVTNAIALLIFVPLLYSLFIAVTAGGLLALALLFAFALSVVLPASFLQSDIVLPFKEHKTAEANA